MGRKKPLKIEALQDFKRAALRGAWRGLRWQGFEKSIVVGTHGQMTCLYRGPHGRCCGVGWLCTEVKSDGASVFEALEAGEITLAKPLADFLSVTDRHTNYEARLFLEEIESTHDGAVNAVDMEASFRRLALAHGVDLPEDGQ